MQILTKSSSQQNFARAIALIAAFLMWLPPDSLAQEWYFHTMNSHALSAQFGRTAKLNYSYQISHSRQLKLSGIYAADKFSINRDRVEADIFFLNAQFQYQVIHVGKVFVNSNIGLGGYYLQSENLLGLGHDERTVHFITGFQGEYYINGGHLAFTFDYDILYLPFSDLYEFLHLPTAGLMLVF